MPLLKKWFFCFLNVYLFPLAGFCYIDFMPELPEVETVARELNSKLINLEILTVEVRTPKLVHVGVATLSPKRKVLPENVRKFKKILRAQKIISVKRRAKLIIFNLSGPYSMLVHLKMTGQFIFEDKKLKQKTGGKYRLLNKLTAPKILLPSKFTHVVFNFTNGSKLYFNDVRKFGYLKIVPDSQIFKVKDLAEFGPEPLDKNFTLDVFISALKKRLKSTIKQVLMDVKIVAGIGNIYSDEILFHAKIMPTREVKSLNSDEIKQIYLQIAPILKRAIKAKGSSVGDFIRTDGSWGKMGKFHFVYGRKNLACKACHTPIKCVKINGRTSSFCQKCQN